jgi:hypothetical protein
MSTGQTFKNNHELLRVYGAFQIFGAATATMRWPSLVRPTNSFGNAIFTHDHKYTYISSMLVATSQSSITKRAFFQTKNQTVQHHIEHELYTSMKYTALKPYSYTFILLAS